MTHTTPVVVNGRWMLRLPDFRAVRYLEHPQWEPSMVSSMAANLGPGDVVYDIGSESGDMSALYAMWGCHVVLVEPNAAAWPNAKATFEANNVAPAGWSVAFAGEERSGMVPVGAEGWPPEADGPIAPEHGTTSLAHGGAAVTTIDDLADTFDEPVGITIDVEGAELLALRGAARVLTNIRPTVWLSIHPRLLPDFGYSKGDILRFVDGAGYTAHLLGTDHEEHWMLVPR